MENPAMSELVLVSETLIEPLQIVARSSRATNLIDGTGRGGSTQAGPNPYELLCISLGTCTITTMRVFADRKTLAVGRMSVSVAFRQIPDDGRRLFVRRIFVEGRLEGKDRVILLGIAKTCPVSRVLETSSKLDTAYAASGDGVLHSEAGSSYMRHAIAAASDEEDRWMLAEENRLRTH